MDAFSVSITKGFTQKDLTNSQILYYGLFFGGFQALMPLIGFFLGTMFASAIEAIDHWVAFGLLAIIGVNMLKEALEKQEECCCCADEHNADLGIKTMFVMAVATSIDALAVGISLAMAGDVNIWIAIALIGIITCLTSALGVKIGNIFGAKFEKKAQMAGGIILILIGLKILLDHLGILARLGIGA